MPFANHRSLIAGLLQDFRESLLVTIEGIPVVTKAIDMAVLAGQHHRPRWPTNGIGAKGVVKANPLIGQAVNMGSFDDSGPISTHRGRSMVITVNKQNIRRASVFRTSWQANQQEQGGERGFHLPKVANSSAYSLR